jgi:hypothetical protein
VWIHGDIYARWLSVGDVYSPLGVPTQDEAGRGSLGGRYSDFVGGVIYWTPNRFSYVIEGPLQTSLSFTWNPVGFGGDLTGSATITLSSNEDLRWVSNTHDNNYWTSHDWMEAWILSNADGLSLAAVEGGTAGPNHHATGGSTHDNNIDVTVNTPYLSDNWLAWVAWNHWQARAQIHTLQDPLVEAAYADAQDACAPIVLQPYYLLL